jgi:rhodanese-related sulfurtransferase
MFEKLKTWLPAGRVPEIAAADLVERLASGEPTVLLDVRTQTEWRNSRIKGAENVPITQMSGAVGTLPYPKDAVIVAICLSAHRSIPAVRLLRERGYQRAVQLRGGMLAWWAARLPAEGAEDDG